MKSTGIAAAAFWLCTFTTAQQLVTVTADYATDDAPSRTVIVRNVPTRTQIVIDAWRLALPSASTITALQLRRDASLREALQAGAWNLVVRIGPATRIAADALPDYASNTSGTNEVFRGVVNTPASPQPNGAVGWSASDSVRIPLSPAFSYGGGGLVIDIESDPLGSEWWPVDADDEAITGSVLPLGTPCGAFASWPATSHIDEHDLVVGRTVRFRLHGEPGAAAWLMVSNSILSVPINLSMLGSPACQLHVLPFAMLGTTVGPATIRPEFGGNAWVDVHLPSDTALLDARLGAQWLEWQSSGFASSNALDITIASIAPSSGFAIVSGQVGANPTVQSLGMPVLGIEIL